MSLGHCQTLRYTPGGGTQAPFERGWPAARLQAAVEAAHERGVQVRRPVGGAHHEDALPLAHRRQLDQQLRQHPAAAPRITVRD